MRIPPVLQTTLTTRQPPHEAPDQHPRQSPPPGPPVRPPRSPPPQTPPSGPGTTRRPLDADSHHCEVPEPTSLPPAARPSRPTWPGTDGSGTTPGSVRYIRGRAEKHGAHLGEPATSPVHGGAEQGGPLSHGGSATGGDPRGPGRQSGDRHRSVRVRLEPRAAESEALPAVSRLPAHPEADDGTTTGSTQARLSEQAQAAPPVAPTHQTDSPDRHTPLFVEPLEPRPQPGVYHNYTSVLY